MPGMFCAPRIPTQSKIVTIAGGRAGVMQTLWHMRSLIDHYKKNSDIRDAACNMIFMTPEKSQFPEAEAIFEWTRDYVRYVRDVLDVETIQTPDKTLINRVGDCDDQTVLLCTLLESVGYRTRFVVAGYSNSTDLEHVYCQVLLNGEWVNADATERESLGYAPPDPTALWIEPV